jgi:hypothetical protein
VAIEAVNGYDTIKCAQSKSEERGEIRGCRFACILDGDVGVSLEI